MPIYLPAINRRSFLQTSAAAVGSLAVGSLAVGRWAAADDAPAADPHRFALLADAHIAGDSNSVARDVNMSANLTEVVKQLIALESRPATGLLVGDCAYLAGLPSDYTQLGKLVAPLASAGIGMHLALGNHDDRLNIVGSIEKERGEHPAVEGKLVTVVEAPRANWFVLDSLRQVNLSPGELGEAQLAWLAKELDARAEKPALIAVHHPLPNPGSRIPYISDLQDNERLWDVLLNRRQVKAVFFGHTHDWHVSGRGGIHLINLPPTAYVFQANKPNGWLDCRLATEGCTLELRCLDTKHPQHGEKHPLAWRAA